MACAILRWWAFFGTGGRTRKMPDVNRGPGKKVSRHSFVFDVSTDGVSWGLQILPSPSLSPLSKQRQLMEENVKLAVTLQTDWKNKMWHFPRTFLMLSFSVVGCCVGVGSIFTATTDQSVPGSTVSSHQIVYLLPVCLGLVFMIVVGIFLWKMQCKPLNILYNEAQNIVVANEYRVSNGLWLTFSEFALAPPYSPMIY